MTESVPAWFSEAIARTPDTGAAEVGDIVIAWRAWGRAGDPVVVLVHGGGAHGGWWDHIAPALARSRRVLALDLSGHGDSGRRDRYGVDSWAAEVVAVAEPDATGVKPVIVGHSLGGIVALTAGATYGERLAGVVSIDAPPVAEPSALDAKIDLRPGRSTARATADRAALVARFRTLPLDTATPPYLVAHIAEQSVCRVDEGWTWKFDPAVFAGTYSEPADVSALPCPTALIRGERGITHLRPELYAGDVPEPGVPVTQIGDSGHHVMLDQPLALIAALDTLIQEWTTRTEGPEPARRGP